MSETVDTTYTRFAADQAYVQANNAFVARLPIQGCMRILDLCCGTGAVGQIMLASATGASYVGIDLDPVQIGLAEANYRGLGYTVRRIADPASALPFPDGRTVGLIVGSATELGFPDATFDAVNISNAIHLIGDKDGLLASISRVLQPGGVYSFSSGFYAGCWPPVTQQVYYEWLKAATAWIAEQSAERVARGEPPIKRQRGKSQLSAVAYGNRWLTPDEWRATLASHGFEVRDLAERPVMFDHDSLAKVGSYSGLAEAQLSGYPTEIAAQALEVTARAALDTAGVDAVQHNWIEVVAVKR
ncbi:class I SAM-dependent methyltransferase [Rubrivivax albus]|uniref:Class I SAM-dependent methyltransferase n=1 Tax=Rubrivivax albus TaxID=2499835 RepID=A0A437K277_9BURK|nr:class I SAM-dependent methyltransferase [Rubrivivax albus]RVT54363.1 class I SAM-dependent methyltransferase [Rubrivivax albus]